MHSLLLSARAVVGAFVLFVLVPLGYPQLSEELPEESVTADEAESIVAVVESYNIVGFWSGLNPAGILVSYLFEQDGSATIFEDDRPVLSGGEHSRVTWDYEAVGRAGNLDIVFTDDFGTVVETRYAALFTADGALLLRSGGPRTARPLSTSEGADPMQIRLLRIE